MNNLAAYNDLKSKLNPLRDEDFIWLLHLYNKGLSRNVADATKDDIEALNSLKEINDIKKNILNHFQYQDERTIDNFIYDLKEYKLAIKSSKIDYNLIKNNKRFLNFACHIMSQEVQEREIKYIKNLYFKFLYLVYTFPDFYKNPRKIDDIYHQFDNVYSKFNKHFNFAESNFFIWAKDYINDHLEFRKYRQDSVDESEYETLINSIFDLIYIEDNNIHYALRRKLSNAWYQKKHREDKKVKKANFYALTKKAREALHQLSFKNNLSEEKMIEKLINESYIKECCSLSGNNLYL